MAYVVPEELAFLVNRNREQKTTNIALSNRVCVITGATSGVGYEATKELVLHGARIVLVARNKEKAEAVKKELIVLNSKVKVDIIIADFSKLIEVQRAGKEILSKFKKIHILINCAGMHSTTKKITEDGFELVFCVNHLASLLFTLLLGEALVNSAPSRIIQVNSEGHRFNGLNEDDLYWSYRIYTGLQAYGASKTAQIMSVEELSKIFFPQGVTINAIHPGEVKTAIGSNNGWLYKFFTKYVTSHFLKDPKIAGNAIYYLAAAKELSTVSGKYFNLTHEELPAKHARDKVKGKRIYDESLKMIEQYL